MGGNKALRRSWTGLLTGMALAGCCLCHTGQSFAPPPSGGVTGAAAQLRAGAAVVNVSLATGVPLAGYSGSPRHQLTAANIPLHLFALAGHCDLILDPTPSTAATFYNPSTGTVDTIGARALVIDNGVRKIAIVKVDTIGMSRKLREDLFLIAKPLGIQYDDFVVVATHTHSGPGGVSTLPLWQVAAADCFVNTVYQQILLAAATALTNADQALQPALLGIGTSSADANQNRSGRPTVFDQELVVVKITTTTGAPIAALFNFAVHGTSYGPTNMQFSADCMGAMEKSVENLITPPGVVAIFTNGAEGDVEPKYAMAQEGTIVGTAVAALWAKITTKSWVELRGAFKDVGMPAPSYNATTNGCLPLPPNGTSTLCGALGYIPTLPLDPNWLSKTLPFQAVRIDDTVFVAIPGEPITEIGTDLKQKAKDLGFTRGVILGLANDHGGYFTTLSEYNRPASYEGQATVYGPTTGAIVVNNANAVMGMAF